MRRPKKKRREVSPLAILTAASTAHACAATAAEHEPPTPPTPTEDDIALAALQLLRDRRDLLEFAKTNEKQKHRVACATAHFSDGRMGDISTGEPCYCSTPDPFVAPTHWPHARRITGGSVCARRGRGWRVRCFGFLCVSLVLTWMPPLRLCF